MRVFRDSWPFANFFTPSHRHRAAELRRQEERYRGVRVQRVVVHKRQGRKFRPESGSEQLILSRVVRALCGAGSFSIQQLAEVTR